MIMVFTTRIQQTQIHSFHNTQEEKLQRNPCAIVFCILKQTARWVADLNPTECVVCMYSPYQNKTCDPL